MKTTTAHISRRSGATVPYPNGATRQENMEKLLNRLLIFASCLGFVGIILFLVALS